MVRVEPLSAEDEERWDRAVASLFERLDVDGDGRVSVDDIKAAIRQNPHLKGFLREQETQCGDGLTKEELFAVVRDRRMRVITLFRSMDEDKSDTLSYGELARGLRRLGVDASDADMHAFFEAIDTNHDGVLTSEEWIEFVSTLPPLPLAKVFDSWARTLTIDLGEDARIPEAPMPDTSTRDMLVAAKFFFVSCTVKGISRSLTAPFERLKIRMQLRASWRAEIAAIYRKQGLRGFFRGNAAHVLRIGPESASKFVLYHHIKDALYGDTHRGDLSARERFVAAGAAGAIGSVIGYPLDVVKTRMSSTTTRETPGMLKTIGRIARHEGFPAFFRGVQASMVGVTLYTGVDLALYESAKHAYVRHLGGADKPSDLEFVCCGLGSSLAAQTVSYPFFLVRTRLQCPTHMHRAHDGTPRFRSMWGVASACVRQDGIRGLWRGASMQYLKAAPAIACSYIVYERMVRALGLD